MTFSTKRSSIPSKLLARTQPHLCTKNVYLDKFLGYFSVVTGVVMMSMFIALQILFLPSALAAKIGLTSNWFSKRHDDENMDDKMNTNTPGETTTLIKKSNKNISNTDVGSLTALKTLSARSTMARVGTIITDSGTSIGINPDYLAPKLMEQLSLYGNGIIGSYIVSQFFLQCVKWNFDLTKRLIQDQITVLASQKLNLVQIEFGENAYLQCRTCWIDDCLETFLLNNSNLKDTDYFDKDLESIFKGIQRVHESSEIKPIEVDVNIIILGSGYDTRSYRFSKYFKANYFEVDGRGTQAMKRKALLDANITEGSTIFVPCDFSTEDWLVKLIDYSMDPKLPTFIIWEGVTMYLKEEDIKNTLECVSAKLGEGSCIAFDYLDSEWALSPKMIAMSTKAGEPIQFGLHGKEAEDLIESIDGLTLMEHQKRDEVVDKYLPKHVDGRPIGFLGNFGGYVLAGK